MWSACCSAVQVLRHTPSLRRHPSSNGDTPASPRLIGLTPMKKATPIAIALLLVCWTAAFAQDRTITVASTTSTEQSGLFGYLLPIF